MGSASVLYSNMVFPLHPALVENALNLIIVVY